MSIIIKEMDLPEKEAVGLFLYPDGRVTMWRPHAFVGHDYEAVAVPGTGKLVWDRHVIECFTDAIVEEAERTGRVRATYQEIANVVATIPAIIEEEGGD